MANKLLKSITFPDLTDKYIVGDTSLSVAGAGADAKATGDALATKANIDGSYSDLTAGSAEQLISTVRTNDKTPYLFRTSGGSVDIGDREFVNAIVGGTVAWNKFPLYYRGASAERYGVTATAYDDWVALNGTATATNWTYAFTDTGMMKDDFVLGHTYYVRGLNTEADDAFGYMNGDKRDGIYNITATPSFRIWVKEGVTYNNYKMRLEFFDLTQMFGSAIADYILALETATAGAGVAFFKKLGFNKPYYAYNAGELMSVSGLSSHDMTGFNQWDEEWENGYIDGNGSIVSDSRFVASKNKIKVLPNTAYYFKAPVQLELHGYDANKAFLRRISTSVVNGIFTIPSDVEYIMFNSKTAGTLTTYNHDICINLAWDNSRNGEYEPYELHSYPLDSTLTLRGIPKLDAYNNLYYDGDEYAPSGEVTRKYGIVDLGTLTWAEREVTGNSFATPFSAMRVSTTSVISTVSYKPCVYWGGFIADTSDYKIHMDSNGSLYVYDVRYASSTAAQFKSAMNGVYLVYELATPTTETADPYTTPQIVNDFGTEEYVTTSIVPVGHDTDYPINLVAKLEMAPNSPEGNGDYIVRQTNGMNEYVPLVIEDALPTIPSTAGSYKLVVTVADGSDPVLSWESEV